MTPKLVGRSFLPLFLTISESTRTRGPRPGEGVMAGHGRLIHEGSLYDPLYGTFVCIQVLLGQWSGAMPDCFGGSFSGQNGESLLYHH